MKRKLAETATHAVTHIRLGDANRCKLDALDAITVEYMALCQQYARHFCTLGKADKFAAPLFDTRLSQRWQRVAIQQAAGCAQSWLTNRQNHAREYQQRQAYYEAQTAQFPTTPHKVPVWTEPELPTLKNVCLQANINVVETVESASEAAMQLASAQGTTFDFWLQIATLTPRRPLYLPVKLATYHRKKLAGKTLNTSTTLNRRPDGSWWLTMTFDEVVKPQLTHTVVGVDVGIANFLTTSTGKRYGSFQGNLARRHRLDRTKRQCKAQLRACLKKKEAEKLPSTSSASGARLTRHIRQSINRSVNQCFEDHPHCTLALEQLSVAGMRFKARAMNAYLYASNLAHIPKQIEWGAAKRGLPVVFVNPAYSSQECSHCHYVSRENRPNQQTFCCVVCGHQSHADTNASRNLACRAEDEALRQCRTLEEVKALLLARHQKWRDGCP